ncbi:glycosyltransferase [Elizabethkingia anophelis]|nr:glycosyltransferase [Elizabethkingia anophelis]
MKVFQISSEVNSGSVGRVAEQIGEEVLHEGWDSYIAYARDNQPSKSHTIRIGNQLDLIQHGVLTRITDRHGFGSKNATKKLIEDIKRINPDIIQLQHLHGYYINIELLFDYLSKINIPVVWTFHDCWSFTGHCAHYEYINCSKWLTQCEKCPQKHEYPKSSLFDNSFQNYLDKKRLFNSISKLTIVPVSNWLEGEVKKSFLKEYNCMVIQNGIDLDRFTINNRVNSSNVKKKLNAENKFVILGVANPWNEKKGLNYFIEISRKLSLDYKIILVGLNKSQIEKLPSNILGLEKTESIKELAELYSASDVFLNPTLEDSFPTTNLESLACGTPVITFKSGGSPEAIDSKTGIIVEKGDLNGLKNAIYEIQLKGKEYYQKACRERAELYFDKNKCFSKYIELYKEILK